MAPHIIGDERSRGTSGQDNRLFVEAVLWIGPGPLPRTPEIGFTA
jgi:hypothetical protein